MKAIHGLRALVTLAVLLFYYASSSAITLFPFFVDVAGDYNDGTPEEFSNLGITTMYYKSPSFYSSLKEADEFLKEVLPFSNEPISRNEETRDKVKIVEYTSPMLDEKVSHIYLVQFPDNKFLVGYKEQITSSSPKTDNSNN